MPHEAHRGSRFSRAEPILPIRAAGAAATCRIFRQLQIAPTSQVARDVDPGRHFRAIPVSLKQHRLRADELEYELPSHLIATRPATPRDSARMLVLRRSDDVIEHRQVRDLPEYLQAGDALVFNNTAVLPARLIGRRADTGGRVEGLFLHETGSRDDRPLWQVMLRSGGRLREGHRIELLNALGQPSGYSFKLRERQEAEWIVHLEQAVQTQTALDAAGWTPLPPYILKARGDAAFVDADDRSWYQTVFADAARRQSVAAPTAGLHFTPELLRRLAQQGVERIDVTLHVGAGTFKPVTAESLDQHRMHSERYEVSPAALEALHRIKKCSSEGSGGRILAVGTTSVRTLESLPSPLPTQHAESGGQLCSPVAGLTDLMIAPPYTFKLTDGMLTNFHLPRSTLLALVGAMVGLDRLKAIYREAIARGYRFYSYGDAMLILP